MKSFFVDRTGGWRAAPVGTQTGDRRGGQAEQEGHKTVGGRVRPRHFAHSVCLQANTNGCSFFLSPFSLVGPAGAVADTRRTRIKIFPQSGVVCVYCFLTIVVSAQHRYHEASLCHDWRAVSHWEGHPAPWVPGRSTFANLTAHLISLLHFVAGCVMCASRRACRVTEQGAYRNKLQRLGTEEAAARWPGGELHVSAQVRRRHLSTSKL